MKPRRRAISTRNKRHSSAAARWGTISSSRRVLQGGWRALTAATQMRSSMSAMSWALLCLAAVVGGCEKPAAPPTPPPPNVTVVHAISRNVVDWDSYTGYLSSPQSANVAARVSGLVISAPFKEGAMVKQGQILFVLDPSPFNAALDAAKAAVAQAQAAYEYADVNYKMYQQVRGSNAVSEQAYEQAKAEADEAEANVKADQAAVETAALNLQWSRVAAPISGRVGEIQVTVGNLVTGGSAQVTTLTTLTTIQSIDPLYGYIPVPEEAYLKYETLMSLELGRGEKVPTLLYLPDHAPIAGHLDFVSNAVDQTTGTIMVRGVFNNPGWLIPGLYATMDIPQGPAHPELLVPATAIVVQQNQRVLYVVNANDVVEIRTVTFGRTFGPLQSVLSGLTTSDQVIDNGLQYAMPGAKVTPHLEEIPASDLSALSGPEQAAAIPAATQPTTAATQPAGAGAP